MNRVLNDPLGFKNLHFATQWQNYATLGQQMGKLKKKILYNIATNHKVTKDTRPIHKKEELEALVPMFAF